MPDAPVYCHGGCVGSTRGPLVRSTEATLTGTWSASWEWAEAGTYRIYADFVPDVTDGPDKVTLTRTVDVAGAFTPNPATATSTTSEVDGYTVTLDGDLTAGESSELTLSVTRDGQPVTLSGTGLVFSSLV